MHIGRRVLFKKAPGARYVQQTPLDSSLAELQMLRGLRALTTAGMPVSHGRVFQNVANQMDCVISSRAVGEAVAGLLLESYATKGFHNKAKSCPWGPMAGFVMADPRFTKNSDMEGQRKDLTKAKHEGGDEIPLYITEERRLALEKPRPGGLGLIQPAGGNINEKIYTATGPTGLTMRFVLSRSLDAPGADGKQLWKVLYAPGEVRLSGDLKSANKGTPSNLLPVMAMIDPSCPSSVRRTYRAATTGDYDLFAIFPRRSDYKRGGADKRMVPGTDRFKVGVQNYIGAEDPHLGNLTPRIAEARTRLNDGIIAAGYRGGNVVHHSDEAGRPMVSSIDFPFIAFVPGDAEAYLCQHVADFKSFIGYLMQKDFVMTFNAGWHRQLGMQTTHVGSYEV